MAEKERSTPGTRREKRERRKTLKAAEEEGELAFDFLKPKKISKKAPAKRRRGRRR